MLVKEERFSKLPSAGAQILEHHFGAVKDNGVYRLRPSENQTEEALTFFAESGFQIFKGLCIRDNVDWKCLPSMSQKISL